MLRMLNKDMTLAIILLSWGLPWISIAEAGTDLPGRAEKSTQPVVIIARAPGGDYAGSLQVLPGPMISEGRVWPRLSPAQLAPNEKALPISLATALRLAGARPLLVAQAEASVQVATARLAKARLEWLPSIEIGAGYHRHDGATQGQSGNYYNNYKDQFLAGGGLSARVALADALFKPIAARQVLRSRQLDVQTAQNDALLQTAEAYFRVEQARGRLAATEDVVAKGRTLVKKIDFATLVRSKPTDLHRARATLAHYEQVIATAREQWRVASDDLTQVLRLDPTATVVPLEPPDLRITLISPQETVDNLIPLGLTSRPELASQQALVQAALARIRQERLRPLVPSLILEGSPGAAGPGGGFMTSNFASSVNGTSNPTAGRDDISVGLVWQLQNFGMGNRALVRERRGEQQQSLLELFRIQDLVAAEIARAHAQLTSAATRIDESESGLDEARLAFEGSLEELGRIERIEQTEVILRRTFEVIEALQSLSRAFDDYFESIHDYNRAQFRLFRALGTPAGILAFDSLPGPGLPVDTTRPPLMAPRGGLQSFSSHH